MNPEIKQAGSSLILLQPELSKFNQFQDCSSSVLAEVMFHALWEKKHEGKFSHPRNRARLESMQLMKRMEICGQMFKSCTPPL